MQGFRGWREPDGLQGMRGETVSGYKRENQDLGPQEPLYPTRERPEDHAEPVQNFRQEGTLISFCTQQV